MYWIIAILLLANWVLGVVSGAQLGLWVHLLLVGGLLVLAVAVVDAARRPRSRRDRRAAVPSPIRGERNG